MKFAGKLLIAALAAAMLAAAMLAAVAATIYVKTKNQKQ